jgi:hypothetical protein
MVPSRFGGRLGVLVPFLEEGQNVPGRVLKPGDWRPGLARDPPIILIGALVALELDAFRRKVINRTIDVIDGEI